MDNKSRDVVVSADETIGLVDALVPLVAQWKWVVAIPLLCATAALAVTYVLKPTYTARTTLLPPQQSQSSAASALASLNALSGLGVPTVRTPADQYASLLQSNAVTNPVVTAFGLKDVYGKALLTDARRILLNRMHVSVGKKDGIITVDVDDDSPQRAAEIANRLVDELHNVTARLVLTEAQQRRQFFEAQLQLSRSRLAQAQQTLGASGFDAGALRAEPKAAAENYARLSAEITATEIRLRTVGQSLTETAPEVRALQASLAGLRAKLASVEAASQTPTETDYISKYREYKYQETLFELFSRQYELARVDEAKDSPAMQVIDRATPPERRSRPRRAQTTMTAFLGSLVCIVLFLEARYFGRAWSRHPRHGRQVTLLRQAWQGKPQTKEQQ